MTAAKATALLGALSIGHGILLAAGIAAVEIVSGLAAAFETDSPAQAVNVMGAAAVCLLALLAPRLRRRKARPSMSASASGTMRPTIVVAHPAGGSS